MLAYEDVGFPQKDMEILESNGAPDDIFEVIIDPPITAKSSLDKPHDVAEGSSSSASFNDNFWRRKLSSAPKKNLNPHIWEDTY